MFFGVILAHNKGSSRLGCGSSGLRFGSLGLNSAQWPLRFGYWAHLDLSGSLKDSDLVDQGSSWLIRTQVWLIGGHCCSSGLNIWLIWTHWESDLAHQDSCWLIRTQVWLIGGHWGSSRLKIWLIRTHSPTTGTHQDPPTHSLGLRFGSSELRFCSSQLINTYWTQIWLIRAHWRSSGPRFGSSTLNGTQIRLIQLILTHIWFIEAQVIGAH